MIAFDGNLSIEAKKGSSAILLAMMAFPTMLVCLFS